MSAESAWKGLYKAGGVCFLLDGVLFIILVPIFLMSGPEPSTGAETLRLMAERQLLTRTVDGVFMLIAVLFVIGMLALYLSLKHVGKTAMLIATALFAVAISLFLGSTVADYSLIGLSGAYASASSEAQRAAYVVASELVHEGSSVADTLGSLIFGVAVIVVSVVMLKGVFGKALAYLGIVNGIVGLIGSIPLPALGILALVSQLILAVWFLAVGYKLYKLG